MENGYFGQQPFLKMAIFWERTLWETTIFLTEILGTALMGKGHFGNSHFRNGHFGNGHSVNGPYGMIPTAYERPAFLPTSCSY